MEYKAGDIVRIKDYPSNYYRNNKLHVYSMARYYGEEVMIRYINWETKRFRCYKGWFWYCSDIDEPELLPCMEPLPSELFEIDF